MFLLSRWSKEVGNMAYLNLMILLSRYIFAGFGILFIIVAYSFMKPFFHYALGKTREKNQFLYICIIFMHIAGVAIVAGKQADEKIRIGIILNGVILFVLISLTLWLLKLWKRHGEIIIWNLIFFIMDMGYIMLERLDHELATKQIVAYILGVSFALILPLIFPLMIRVKNKYLYLTLLMVTMILPFIAGSQVLGATNWVNIGGIAFQPSEIGKVALVLFLAALFGKEGKPAKKDIILSIGVVGLSVGALVLQRDLGAALLYYLTFLMILLVATQSFLFPFLGIVIGSCGAVIGYFLFGHVRVRVEAWLDPWQDITGSGYQVVQGLFAIGTWGWLGSGLTRGAPEKIPFAATDYIFPALCEEFGNLLGIIILLAYLGLILQCIRIAFKQRNMFYILIIMGIGALFSLQTFIIIGGVFKLIPLTGITTPFLSAGGSSIVVSLGMMGLISCFSYQVTADETEQEEEDA